VGKKTEGESADSDCVDGKTKGEGQRRIFGLPPVREARDGSDEKTGRQRNHDKV